MSNAINLEASSDSDLHTMTFDLFYPLAYRVIAQKILQARKARANGFIVGAFKIEASIDRLYSELPEDLRW